jgi:hypothetical protein
MRRLTGILIVTLCACGCQETPPVARIPFPQAEYAALPKTGTGVVRGQAFLKTRGGDVKTAAGSLVWLNPATSYAEQWYEVGYLKDSPLEPVDPRVRQYNLETVADAEGRFEFRNVPPGDYFLATQVVWEAPTGYRGSPVPQGGLVAKRITVRDGQEQQVVLTR